MAVPSYPALAAAALVLAFAAFPAHADEEHSQATGFSYLNTTCPLDSPVTKITESRAGAESVFCGAMFRGINSPQYLANWRAIPTHSKDVFFMSNPPAGTAKAAGIGLVGKLTGGVEVSGHTEFYDWGSDPTGASMKAGEGKMFADLTAADEPRIIGTHVAFDWLPTEVRTTPAGQQPRRVVCLVREPKENFVSAAVFGGGVEGIGPLVDAQVAAVKGTGSGETGVPSRGFAGFANGCAAAVGGEARGGPKVFLLSQARLADPSTVSAHVAELAKFLEVSDYADDEEHNAKTVQLAQSAIGDVSQMDAAKAALADEAFAAPHVDPRVTALYETAATGAFNRSAGSSSAKSGGDASGGARSGGGGGRAGTDGTQGDWQSGDSKANAGEQGTYNGTSGNGTSPGAARATTTGSAGGATTADAAATTAGSAGGATTTDAAASTTAASSGACDAVTWGLGIVLGAAAAAIN